MIKSLKVKGFKSLKNVNLDFSPGINVLIGKTTSGKTPVLQAIMLAGTNRPSGLAFKNTDFKKKEPVEIEVETSRGSFSFSKNYDTGVIYQIQDLKFEKVGVDVPEEIRNLLRLKPINMHHAQDSAFMIGDNAKFTSFINEVTGAEEATALLLAVNKELSELKKRESLESQNIQSIREKLSKFALVDDLEKKNKDLKKHQNILNLFLVNLKNLQEIQEELKKLKKDSLFFKKINLNISKIVELEKKIEKELFSLQEKKENKVLVQNFQKEKKELTFLSSKNFTELALKIEKEIKDKNESEKNKVLLSSFLSIKRKKEKCCWDFESKFSSLLKEKEELLSFQKKKNDLNSFLSIKRRKEKVKIKEITSLLLELQITKENIQIFKENLKKIKKLKSISQDLKELENEFNEVKEEFKDIEQCPTCGNSIKIEDFI